MYQILDIEIMQLFQLTLLINIIRNTIVDIRSYLDNKLELRIKKSEGFRIRKYYENIIYLSMIAINNTLNDLSLTLAFSTVMIQ